MSSFLTQYSGLIYDYIGLVWIPVGLVMAHRPHRWLMTAFVVTCLLTLRLQVELMDSTGHPTGFLPIMSSDVYIRGLILYSAVFTLFMILARFSPKTQPTIFFAAALSVYILAFCSSMLLMIL